MLSLLETYMGHSTHKEIKSNVLISENLFSSEYSDVLLSESNVLRWAKTFCLIERRENGTDKLK